MSEVGQKGVSEENEAGRGKTSVLAKSRQLKK